MVTETVTLRRQLTPWSRHAVWWFILVEGLVVATIGSVFLLLPPTGFGTAVIGIYLFGDGIITIFHQLKRAALDHTAAVKLMHGTIGLTIGFVVLIPRILISLSGIPIDPLLLRPGIVDTLALTSAAFQVLLSVAGSGLVLWSIARFWEAILQDDAETRVGDLLVGMGFFILAILTFLEFTRITYLSLSLGIFLIIIGVLLVMVALLRRRGQLRKATVKLEEAILPGKE